MLNPFSENFAFKNIDNTLTNIFSYINPFSENFILKDVLKFLGDMLSYINPFSDNFILKDVLKFLGDMLSYINPFDEKFLGKKIVDLLGELLQNLFIPSENSLNQFSDIWNSKLGFIDTIKTDINAFKNMFNNINSVPKYVIDVNSKWYVGEITVIDFSWYAPFKNYGDIIITAFIYVFFIWRLFKHLPSIISGVDSGIDVVSSKKG